MKNPINISLVKIDASKNLKEKDICKIKWIGDETPLIISKELGDWHYRHYYKEGKLVAHKKNNKTNKRIEAEAGISKSISELINKRKGLGGFKMRIQSKGKCCFCNSKFSGTAIGRHLLSCKERIQDNKEGKIFHFRASNGPFWVHFELNGSENLKAIDSFLRGLWLECCGHLSAFTINGVEYHSMPDQCFEKFNDMNYKIQNIISKGTIFSHEYDFGSTTELKLKCVEVHSGNIEGIKVLSRNEMPKFICHKCDQREAKHICSECWEESLLCDECTKEHSCDEEMFLSVCNSPRMGVCGYSQDDE